MARVVVRQRVDAGAQQHLAGIPGLVSHGLREKRLPSGVLPALHVRLGADQCVAEQPAVAQRDGVLQRRLGLAPFFVVFVFDRRPSVRRAAIPIPLSHYPIIPLFHYSVIPFQATQRRQAGRQVVDN